MGRHPFLPVVAVVFVLTLTGCASHSTSKTVAQADAPATVPAQESQPMSRPFMFDEAKLPEGFPPPGPVGEVWVKHYPAYRAARVESMSLKKPGQDEMFWPLFNHIKKEKIAMSAPVVMDYDANGQSEPVAMEFVYATPTLGSTGSDGNVKVADFPSMTVVSVGVRGSYNAKTLAKATSQLDSWLVEQGGKFDKAGSPRYLGYNSPLVPWFLRYGEVQIPITLVENRS